MLQSEEKVTSGPIRRAACFARAHDLVPERLLLQLSLALYKIDGLCHFNVATIAVRVFARRIFAGLVFVPAILLALALDLELLGRVFPYAATTAPHALARRWRG